MASRRKQTNAFMAIGRPKQADKPHPTGNDQLDLGGWVSPTNESSEKKRWEAETAGLHKRSSNPGCAELPTPVSGKQYTATATPGTPLQVLRNHSIRQADIYHSEHYEAYKTYKNPAFPGSLQSSYSSESFPFPSLYLPHIPCAGSHR